MGANEHPPIHTHSLSEREAGGEDKDHGCDDCRRQKKKMACVGPFQQRRGLRVHTHGSFFLGTCFSAGFSIVFGPGLSYRVPWRRWGWRGESSAGPALWVQSQKTHRRHTRESEESCQKERVCLHGRFSCSSSVPHIFICRLLPGLLFIRHPFQEKAVLQNRTILFIGGGGVCPLPRHRT